MGAPLAQMTSRVALTALFERIPDIRVPAQELSYRPTVVVRTMNHLLCEWDVTS
jgi:cytochrome P450